MYTQTRIRTLRETGRGTLEGRGGDDVWYQSLGKWNGEGRLGQRTYCSRQQSENGLRLLPTVLTLQVTATTTAPGM